MIKRLLLFFSFVILFVFLGIQISPYIRGLLLSTGVIEEKVLIAGTGSMYPTFPKGEGKNDLVQAQEIVAWPQMRKYPSGINIFGYNFFTYKMNRGDIVEFENEETKKLSKEKYDEEAGFVKRVIALPQDTVNLRDGYVILNGQTLDEPYTARPRSTYGGNSLPDCQNLQIPEGKVFILGDNRKASLDSRYELGLIDLSDIKYVLPWNKQAEYRKLWRDTKDDTSYAHTTTLDGYEFVRLLNEKRKEKNLKAYKYNPLLTNSGKIRGFAMIKSDDFSTEATRSGMPLEKAIKEAGYENIIYAEVSTRGYYEASELVDNFLEFPDTKKILYSSDYQEIGVAAVLGEVNNCPTQVVVAHLGGYVPPNYPQDTIDSWAGLVDNLEKVLPSWRSLRQADNIDKEKVRRLVEILETRLSNAQKIFARMKANQWLNDSEKKMVEDDKRLGEEAEKIIGELMKK
ncbi:signal peptidase I [Candidatus Gottesmanbacteria bacterium]|nr:signal peptidase I [Candidatus Gottesmanbacteria bacterium]